MYIGRADSELLGRTLAAVRGTPVLTVTDVASNAQSHGIINFVTENNHVRFDIDEQAASDNGLAISSKLLNLARSVKPRPQP